MTTVTTLKGVSNIGDPQLSEIIRDNLIVFLDWGLLNTGAYFNVTIPTSGAYGGSRHVLRPISDPRYTDGQVWQAYRQNWVWESGISPGSPINISGVFIGDSFDPIESGNYIINYPEGKIVFNTAISTASTVQLEYSHKWIKIIAAKDIPWFQEVSINSFRVDSNNFVVGSGLRTQLAQSQIELPVVAIETLDNKDYTGYQLGGGHWAFTDIVFRIISEDDTSSYRLADVLSNQEDSTIFLFDTGLMARQDAFPLKHDGSKSSNPKTYPDLVELSGNGGFRYDSQVKQGKLSIVEATAGSNQKLSHRLYHSTARWRTEVILHNI
jgi:hypothetical protein